MLMEIEGHSVTNYVPATLFYIESSSHFEVLLKYISLKHSSTQSLQKCAGGCSRALVLVNILYGFTCTYKVNLYKVASTKIKLLDQKIKGFGKVYVLSLLFISCYPFEKI